MIKRWFIETHHILILLLIVLQLMCAIRGRPGGGPVDKIPPEIIFTHPKSDSIEVKYLRTIEIHFSERMDESSVEQSIFISPPLTYDTDWSGGDELTLILSDSLREEKTYVVTVGSGAMDARKNRLRDSFQFAFATGDRINDGKITGKVFGISAQDNFYIYAYQMVHPDSLDPVRSKADFLSQPGEDGSFLLNYLSYGQYRVFVVEDLNRNLLLDPDFERIGIPFTDVYLDSINISLKDLNFRITRMDTTAPTLVGARPVNNKKVLLRISEPVKNLMHNNISITDSLYLDTLAILGYAQNQEESNQYFLYTVRQKPGQYYQVSVNNLSDSSGNYQSEIQRQSFLGSDLDDTTHFQLLTVAPADSADNLPLNTAINIEFSLPIDTLSLYKNFVCTAGDSDTLIGLWEWQNLSNGFYRPQTKLQPGQVYFYHLTTENIQSLWGDSLSDSTLSRTIFLKSENEFGSLSGQLVIQEALTHNAYVTVYALDKKMSTHKILIDDEKLFRVPWLPEGQYKIGVFLDLDDNTEYSPGTLVPFQYSEPFTVQDDTIKVRKRWEVSDIDVYIPGVN